MKKSNNNNNKTFLISEKDRKIIPLGINKITTENYLKELKNMKKIKMYLLFKNTFIEEDALDLEYIDQCYKLFNTNASVNYYDNILTNVFVDPEDENLEVHLYDLFTENTELTPLNKIPEENPNQAKIFKLYVENDNDNIHLVLYYGYSRSGKYNQRSYIVKMKKRDFDIAIALVNKTITVVMASLLIAKRDLEKKNIPLYRKFEIPKKNNNKVRIIHSPNEKIKKSLKFLNNILNKTMNTKLQYRPTNQFAYIQGRNILEAAKIHKNNYYTCSADIKDYFPSLKWEYITPYLKFVCKDENLLEELKPVFINPETGGMYQGNPCSGQLGNLVLYKVARYLGNITKKKGISYTIYSDDFMFSSNTRKLKPEYVNSLVKHCFEHFGLDIKLNEEKTKMRNGQRRLILGLNINHNNEITVGNDYLDKIRACIHNIEIGNQDKNEWRKENLIGKLVYAKFIDETGKVNKLIKTHEKTLNDLGFNGNKKELIYYIKKNMHMNSLVEYEVIRDYIDMASKSKEIEF